MEGGEDTRMSGSNKSELLRNGSTLGCLCTQRAGGADIGHALSSNFVTLRGDTGNNGSATT
jgi:hypothetical protein